MPWLSHQIRSFEISTPEGALEVRGIEGDLQTAITETYARSAKALVQVGPVKPGDADRPVGLAFEFVALANPYAGADVLPVRLSWKGEPVEGAPISILRKADEVERHLVRTDADGRADIPIGGGGEFLLNAVHLEPVEVEKHVWESTWASLTFGLARRQ
ncbi:hypothetical protein BH23PLA1_BH23PLA1_41520 [soil metagenome]